MNTPLHWGIIGGGPAALYLAKRIAESGVGNLQVSIFEKSNELGNGMPYSRDGANPEHVTNVSDNEIPELHRGFIEWAKKQPVETLTRYEIDADKLSAYRVLPRLLFGQYLRDEFRYYISQMKLNQVKVEVHYATTVTDLELLADGGICVYTDRSTTFRFSQVIVCTGHSWPDKNLRGYFASPYPPSKLSIKANYPVAIRGSSLTAVDAIKTLAINNGNFEENEKGLFTFTRSNDAPDFKLVMHSIGALLPAVRFHFEDSHIPTAVLIADAEIPGLKERFGGFIPLDYIFDRCFKAPLKEREPDFYEKIKDMAMEEFVAHVMTMREKLDAFTLLKAEYTEALKSIRRKQSVHWKEMLATLSYAINYPAKHMCAEDMLRFRESLMPLISVVIAFVPQSSCKTLLALYEAGALEIVDVDRDSKVEPRPEGGITYHYKNESGEPVAKDYNLFVDCMGQQPFRFEDFPFPKLREQKVVSPARLKFKDEEAAIKAKDSGKNVERDEANNFYLRVPGVCINDQYQVIDQFGAAHPNIYLMSVPLIAGLNPDYSGLDFCEVASERIMKNLAGKIPVEA